MSLVYALRDEGRASVPALFSDVRLCSTLTIRRRAWHRAPTDEPIHDPVYVRGDPTALTLAVRNLLDNARKFAPSGSVRLRVWQDDREAHLDVTDSGPGIPEAALPHLFERFYQADVTHRQQGSGLGLALVHSIATWHGGRIVAANAPGGATFTLSLPRDSTSPS